MARLLCLAILHVSILVQYTISEPILERPTGDHLENVHRFRRRVNRYEGDGPISYLKELRNDMIDENGTPIDLENGPTTIWCSMDHGNYINSNQNIII